MFYTDSECCNQLVKKFLPLYDSGQYISESQYFANEITKLTDLTALHRIKLLLQFVSEETSNVDKFVVVIVALSLFCIQSAEQPDVPGSGERTIWRAFREK